MYITALLCLDSHFLIYYAFYRLFIQYQQQQVPILDLKRLNELGCKFAYIWGPCPHRFALIPGLGQRLRFVFFCGHVFAGFGTIYHNSDIDNNFTAL